MPDCQLYLLTPPDPDPARLAPLLAQALDAAPVAALQLYVERATATDIARAVESLMPIAQARDVAFILGGHPDLAVR